MRFEKYGPKNVVEVWWAIRLQQYPGGSLEKVWSPRTPKQTAQVSTAWESSLVARQWTCLILRARRQEWMSQCWRTHPVVWH